MLQWCCCSLLMLTDCCLVIQSSPATSLGVLPRSTVSHCLLYPQLCPTAQLTSAAAITHCGPHSLPRCPDYPPHCSPLPSSPRSMLPIDHITPEATSP